MDYPEHRVLSGVQPSGTLHLGNYFGAIKQHIELQDEFPGECFYFIADYHSLTTVQDAEKLRELVQDVAVTYLSLGLDPDKATLWRQSDVPEVTELTWLLSTVTGMGLLERAVSFKDKIDKGIKPTMGLFNYPILMASDILIFGSSVVPVGKDQIQHIEMTQDMATHFNQAYCPGAPVLRKPEWRLSKTPYVPGIDGDKMSKSYGNTIDIFASGKKLKKRCGQVVTDSTEFGQPLPTQDCNILDLLALFSTEEQMVEIKGWFTAASRDGETFGWGHAKALLAERIDARFADARAKREHFLAHPEEVEAILQAGAARARKEARATIDACRKACGLTR
jgi:tryptophanyl-tRNA synthetase